MEQFEVTETLTQDNEKPQKKSTKKTERDFCRKSLFIILFVFIFVFCCGLLVYKYSELIHPLLSKHKKSKIIKEIEENGNTITYRLAERKDVPVILQFIHDLATYEKFPEIVTATEESLHEWIFEQEKLEVLLVFENGEAAGHAAFFRSFSAFLGKPGIYLDNLYVMPEHRGKKYGEGLLRELAKMTIENGGGRLEWRCLNWNTPSYNFYLSKHAKPLDNYTGFRVEGDDLIKLANNE